MQPTDGRGLVSEAGSVRISHFLSRGGDVDPRKPSTRAMLRSQAGPMLALG